MSATAKSLTLMIVLVTIFRGHETKKSTKTIYFSSTEVAFNPLYLQDHRLDVLNATLDVVLNVAQNFNRDPWVAIAIGIKNRNKDAYRTLLQYDVNVCSVLGRNGDNFIKTWIENFLKYGDLPKSCPILKGNYSWHNLKADKLSIPDVMPTSQYRAKIDTYFRRNAARESIANLTVFFELK